MLERFCRLLAALGGIALACTTATAAPVVIRLVPANATVTVNQTVSVDVIAENVSDLYSWQFDLTFDPTTLSGTAQAEGAFPAGSGLSFFIDGTVDNSAGSFTGVVGGLFGPTPGLSGSGVLASFSFLALSPGASEVSLSNLLLLDSGLADIETTSVGTRIVVSNVPEPSSVLLTALGLGLLVNRRRQS